MNISLPTWSISQKDIPDYIQMAFGSRLRSTSEQGHPPPSSVDDHVQEWLKNGSNALNKPMTFG